MASAPSESPKWPYITHLESCPNRHSPIDSSDESRKLFANVSGEFVRFNKDGSAFAFVNPSGLFQIWSVVEQRLIGSPLRLPGNLGIREAPIMARLTADSDLRLLAYYWSSGAQFGIQVWSVTERRRVCSLDAFNVTSLQFSPDSSMLVSANTFGFITLWNLRTCQVVGEPIETGDGDATYVAFSPDGNVLASVGGGRVRLWDTQTRLHTEVLKGDPYHTEEDDIQFSPDGSSLWAGGWLWDVGSASLSMRACYISNRNLTAAEWPTYMGAKLYALTCPPVLPEFKVHAHVE
jgi:WD40 repeat protein